ncbi:MAG: hypothetical protein AAGH41_04950 [Pseudomonadota bacterium]
MSTFSAFFALAAFAGGHSPVLEERIDLYDPSRGAFLGSEVTIFARDGRRLRQENRDAGGASTLTFLVVHNEDGREERAIYFEGSDPTPWTEQFTYTETPPQQTITYFTEDGEPADRTVVTLSLNGRELAKEYYRPGGDLYGREKVLWRDDGTQEGWDFRYTERSGGASFRYRYVTEGPDWKVRVRSRDGEAERTEVRTRFSPGPQSILRSAVPFARGIVSTDTSETSVSATSDGKTLVFARYSDWGTKSAFLASWTDNQWAVESLTALGAIYNLAIAPDGRSIITASENDGALKRYTFNGATWVYTDNISEEIGATGSYPQITSVGDLIFYDPTGKDGGGLYRAKQTTRGFLKPEPLFIPSVGVAFDGFLDEQGVLFFTWCKTDSCARKEGNGVYRLDPGATKPVLLPAIDYVWGIQPLEALGLVLMTDGDDILATPLDTLSPPSEHPPTD